MLLCSVLVAKTLAYMVDSLESPQALPETQAFSQQIPAPPFHRRALSDKFLRMGVDDISTGSISQAPDRR
jgi:hypothetical protein